MTKVMMRVAIERSLGSLLFMALVACGGSTTPTETGSAPPTPPTPPTQEPGTTDNLTCDKHQAAARSLFDAVLNAPKPRCASDSDCATSRHSARCAGPLCGVVVHVSQLDALKQAAAGAKPHCDAYQAGDCPPPRVAACVTGEALCVNNICTFSEGFGKRTGATAPTPKPKLDEAACKKLQTRAQSLFAAAAKCDPAAPATSACNKVLTPICKCPQLVGGMNAQAVKDYEAAAKTFNSQCGCRRSPRCAGLAKQRARICTAKAQCTSK